jgi:hypothetical protein
MLAGLVKRSNNTNSSAVRSSQSQSQSSLIQPQPQSQTTDDNKQQKQTANSLSFADVVNVHSTIVKFKNKILQGKTLTIDELTTAHINYDTLKFADYEESVHYKVLARDMHRLRVFSTLESATHFCSRLVVGSKLISFNDLLQAIRSEDLVTRDVVIGYLRFLAHDGDHTRTSNLHSTKNSSIPTLPNISQATTATTRKSADGIHLFAQKIVGSASHLSLIPRQKQTLVRQDSDLQNLSIRARPRPVIRKTEQTINALNSPHSRAEVSVTSRIKMGLQRADSGYSYRQQEGAVAKSSGLKVISHDSRSFSESEG